MEGKMVAVKIHTRDNLNSCKKMLNETLDSFISLDELLLILYDIDKDELKRLYIAGKSRWMAKQ